MKQDSASGLTVVETHLETIESGASHQQRYQQSLLTITIGALVAVNFALAKFGVLQGLSPLTIFYWQILGAVFLLLIAGFIRKGSFALKSAHFRYYGFSGLLSVSAPNLMANWALLEVPASTFSVLVTLSPLFTFALSALYERKALSAQRLLGIFVGFGAVLLVTGHRFNTDDTSLIPMLLALLVPALLASGNVYRSKAYPTGGDALSLATGMLLSQVVLLTPVYVLFSTRFRNIDAGADSPQLISAFHAEISPVLFAGIVLMVIISALSYLMTFRLQKMTDSVGFSQVGYFVTLTGVAIGILFFDEPLTLHIIVAIGLLFTGLALTNGHLTLNPFFKK